MSVNLQELEPRLLWKHFDEIRKIPRCSGHEKAAADYIISVAKTLGYAYKQDSVGNVVVRVPATPGHENAPTVILQGHLDMVCEKNSDVEFDFSKDPIQLRLDGDWLMAQGTTLGADNGVGVAAALAVLEDASIVHGPLELLFTIDEETGLTGASQIGEGMLTGKTLLNLDSEDDGVFFIGCAGGENTYAKFKKELQSGEPSGEILKITVKGLKGGHSGLDINLHRGNAILFIARMLWTAARQIPFELIAIEGGDKRNAIPREAFAEVSVPKDKVETFEQILTRVFDDLKGEYGLVEENMEWASEKREKASGKALTAELQKRLLNFLLAVPHGILEIHPKIQGLIETSNNLATAHFLEDEIEVALSSRSSINSALHFVSQKLRALCELAGATAEQPPGYPGWTPNLDSPVLQIAKETYKKLFGEEPKMEAIHAGLECGILSEKYPGLDMVSFGPEIQHPHSPDERVSIPTVKKFYTLLGEILKTLTH